MGPIIETAKNRAHVLRDLLLLLGNSLSDVLAVGCGDEKVKTYFSTPKDVTVFSASTTARGFIYIGVPTAFDEFMLYTLER
jgi:hypothetical protein